MNTIRCRGCARAIPRQRRGDPARGQGAPRGTAAVLLLALVGCAATPEATPSEDLRGLRDAYRALSLEGIDAAGLADRADGLAALPAGDDAARAAREACVGFLRTLSEVERGRGAAAAADPSDPGAHAALDRLAGAVSRADALGSRCQELLTPDTPP